MIERRTRMTHKGQVTIPRAVREKAGLKPGDMVTFEVEGEVVKVVRAPSRIAAGFASVEPKRRPEDFRSLRDDFESAVADGVMRETA